MNRRGFLLGTVAAIGGAGMLFYGFGSGKAPGISLGAAQAQDAAAVDKSLVKEMSLGNPDAKVTVIEYASFTCPHCGSFHETGFKKLKADYIDTGKIYFIYREVYFDRFGLWAGMLARCGGGDRYFGIADLIYQGQQEWIAGGDPAQVAANLRQIGKTAGLSEDEVNACMQDADLAQAMVAVYQENATADGINSTPSFVINGQKYANMAYGDFQQIIDDALGG